MNFDTELTIEKLSEQNIEEVHQFCENNVDHWTQSLHFFRLSSLNDTNFSQEFTLVARNPNKQVIAFFQGTTRKFVPFYQPKCILKFFVIHRQYRRQGLGTWMLIELYKRYHSLGLKGKIGALTCTPDYWFPGVRSDHTAAIFWLQKNGFKKGSLFGTLYRQNLYVDFDDPNIPINLDEKPVSERGNYKYMRITPEYFDKTFNFVKKHHGLGSWPEEVKLGYRNNPPTTFIAVDKTNDEVVGWATHSGQFGGSFGPTGVLKSLRGQGIGGILFKWTLYDLKQQGYKRCEIMWVTGDTVKYYSKVAGAYIGQVLWPMTGKIKIPKI